MALKEMFRPNGEKASTLTLTQFFHEWVHTLEQEGWVVADAGRGKPSFPADKDAISAMEESLHALKRTAAKTMPYGTSPLGEFKYREEAANGYTNEYGIDFKPEQIVFTPGGQFGLSAAFYALEARTPGGIIITPKPWYLNHQELAEMFDGRAILSRGKLKKIHPISLDKASNFRLNAEMLEREVAKVKKSGRKIAAFLFCNPSNPLGTVLTKSEWKEIALVLKRHPNIPILMDEAFAEIVFSGDFNISLLHASPECADRTILFRSGTKALGLSGERLAVMAVPKMMRGDITAFQSRLIGNTPLSAQAGMARALSTMSIEKKRAISAYYKRNMEYSMKQLEDLGISTLGGLKPEGCFYILADFSSLIGAKMPKAAARAMSNRSVIRNDTDIAIALLFGFGQKAKHSLGTIPGSAFGMAATQGYLRISFSSHAKELEEVAAALKDVVLSVRT